MRPLLAVSVAIAIAAAAAPSLFEQYMESAGGKAVPARAAERPAREPGSRQVEIAAEPDGHFYVEAEVNFRAVRLMVDTGASVIALRETDAAAAGIRLLPGDFEHPVSTANGVAHAAETLLHSVRIRDIEVSDVRALVLPDESLSVSLLGGAFLSRLARYEVSDGTLIFEN